MKVVPCISTDPTETFATDSTMEASGGLQSHEILVFDRRLETAPARRRDCCAAVTKSWLAVAKNC